MYTADSPGDQGPVIAVIGGGASGTLAAAQRAARPAATIRLITSHVVRISRQRGRPSSGRAAQHDERGFAA